MIANYKAMFKLEITKLAKKFARIDKKQTSNKSSSNCYVLIASSTSSSPRRSSIRIKARDRIRWIMMLRVVLPL